MVMVTLTSMNQKNPLHLSGHVKRTSRKMKFWKTKLLIYLRSEDLHHQKSNKVMSTKCKMNSLTVLNRRIMVEFSYNSDM